jgi:peptide/nickel transport system permease protein
VVRFIAGRALQAAISILFIATVVFLLVRLTGDPARLLVPDFAPPELVTTMRERLGLDRPLFEQYLSYIGQLATLDLGQSFSGRPVIEVLAEKMPATASLALVALVISALVGVPLGILAAVKRGRGVDAAAQGVALIGQSVPSFWLSIMLILVFAVVLRWFPAAGQQGPLSYVLPGIAMAFIAVAGFVRLTRSSMLEVMDKDYVRMAKAKGLPTHTVVLKHGLRNAILPVLTFAGLVVGTFLNGSVVVETIFGWPGIGNLSMTAVTGRDFPVVQGAVIMFAVFYIVINFVVDVLYVALDPRIRYR